MLVYAESGGRPKYAVVEGTTADVLDVPNHRACHVIFTSGPHKDEEGYIWTDSLPSKSQAALKELTNPHRPEPSRNSLQDEVSAAQWKVEQAETDLRKYRLADEDKCRKTAELQSWASGLQQIPATVIDKGVLRHVPYKSFRAGDYEVNIYGDPDNPAGVEVGIYKSLIQSRDAKSQCMEFMSALLNDPADRELLKSLKLTEDIKIRDGLTFEVTPETAEDAYGGWWISVYDSAALDRSRASPKELAAITVPKQPPPSSRDGVVSIWFPHQQALSRPGGKTVYVHSYTRKNGTYVHAYTRSAPGSGSHRRR